MVEFKRHFTNRVVEPRILSKHIRKKRLILFIDHGIMRGAKSLLYAPEDKLPTTIYYGGVHNEKFEKND